MSDAKKEKTNKKINKMTSDELDKAIEKTKQNQGDLSSRYGKELIKQKEVVVLKGKKK